MSEYVIFHTDTDGFDRHVLCLSSESLLSYMQKIETALAEETGDAKILIDQLLITGNGANRFMSCVFSDGRLDFKKAEVVSPDEFFRKETVEWLHDHNSYTENSILIEEQCQKIQENIAF